MTIIILVRRLLKAVRYTNTALILLATAFLILLGTVGSYLVERSANSGFKNLWDSFWWVMTTISTVGYGDRVPATVGGRIIGIVIMVGGPVLLVSMIGSIGISIYSRWTKGITGMAQIKSQDHVIICGWNSKAGDIVSEIEKTAELRNSPITIIDDRVESKPTNGARTSFVRGNSSEVAVLKRANLADARFAVVLAEDNTPAADQKTVLTVLAIKKTNPAVIACAEINDANNEEHLRLAGCDIVVISSFMTSRLLAMSLQNPTVNVIIKELISQYGNEIFRLPMPAKYAGRSFADVMNDIKLSGAAIAIGVEREGQCKVNPSSDFVLKPGDFIMAIAEEQPSL